MNDGEKGFMKHRVENKKRVQVRVVGYEMILWPFACGVMYDTVDEAHAAGQETGKQYTVSEVCEDVKP